MAGRFSIETVFKAIDRITAPVRKMEFSVKAFTKAVKRDFVKAQRSVDRFTHSVGNKLKQGIKRGLAAGLIVLGVGLAAAAAEFVSFDKSIVGATAKFKDVDTSSAAAGKTLEQLRVTARKVGAETQFSATQAAQGLEFLGMAGFTSSQAIALLPKVTDLATVAGIDLASATDMASDALGAFNLNSDNTAELTTNLDRVMDVMAKTITSTNTDMRMLFETMKLGGPPFAAAGQEIETFAAIAGRMASSGLKATQSGTALRSMITRLEKPTKDVTKGLAAFGLTQADIIKDGKIMDMVEVMKLMEIGSKNLTTVQRDAALASIVGKNAVSAWAAVMNEGVEKTELLKIQLLGAKGAAAKMADFMRGSLFVKLQILKSSLIELGFKFIEAFEEKGKGALEAVTKAVQNFDPGPIIDGFKMAVNTIGTFWSIIKPVLPFIIGLVIAWKSYKAILIITAFAQLAMNTAMLGNPVGLAIIAMGLLIGLYLKFQPSISAITTGIIAMSVAMSVLNAIMIANPVGAIITGTTLLVGLFLKLAERTGGVKNAFIVMGKVVMQGVLFPVNMVIDSFLILFNLLAKLPKVGGTFKNLAQGLSGVRNKINKPFDITELDKTGKSFITAGIKQSIGSREEGEADAAGFPSLTPVLTQRETIQKSLQENKTTNRVVIENQSQNPASHNGSQFNTGQSIMIPESGN